jgi:hypothetical protein
MSTPHLPPILLPRRRFNPRVPLQGMGQDGGNDPLETLAAQDEGTLEPEVTRRINGVHHTTFPRGIPNWENIDQDNYVLLGAIGTTVIIISYVVPPGRNGIIYKVANNFVGGGWVEGTGDILWRILVDGAPPPGATSYDAILASLGNPASPTEIPGFRIFENQVLTIVAFNNPAGANGGVVVAGQRVGGRFVGWNYPTDIEESDIWI